MLSSTFTVPDIDAQKIGEVATVLEDYERFLRERTATHLGYPYNLDFDYADIRRLQEFSINNLGDPFVESNYGVHSRPFEIAVLDWFARLWDIFRDSDSPRKYWGYVTNCGTEGNLHGIYVGRENFPDAVLYTSDASHYSIFKAARMYRMEVIKIPADTSGHMDVARLAEELAANIDKPAIVNVNIGTTMTGAVDDLDGILGTLRKTHGHPDQRRFYVHCDGALMGMIVPFLSHGEKLVTFAKEIDSISVSGHKFLGTPVPCGVLITRLEHIGKFASDVEYINSRDATITGSRNGHAPVYMWRTLVRKGFDGLVRDAVFCIENARYLVRRLRDQGVEATLNDNSNTVVMPTPPAPVVRKWQLACKGLICHVVVMPNVTTEKIDLFLEDYFGTKLTLATTSE